MSTPTVTTPPASEPTLQAAPLVRLCVYVVTAFGSILLTYGKASDWGWIGEPELAAWASIVALVNGLAATNVQLRA